MNPQNPNTQINMISAADPTSAASAAKPSTTSTANPKETKKNTLSSAYQFYRHTISARGLPYVNQSRNLAIARGVFQDVVLMLLLPAATALAKAQPVWGLGITGWLVVLAIIAVAGVILDYIMSMKVFYAALDFVQSVHRIIGDEIVRIPLGWFRPGTAGRFSWLASNELMQLGKIMAHQLWQVGTSVTSLLTILVGAFFWGWRLGLTLLVAIPVYWGLVRVSQYYKQHGDGAAKSAEVGLANRLVEFTTCQGTLRAVGVGTDFELLQLAVAENERQGRKNLWWSLLANLVTGAFAQIVLVTMIVIAESLTIGGVMEPVEAVAFIGISLRFVMFIEDIGTSIIDIEDRRHFLTETQEILDAPELPEPGGESAGCVATNKPEIPGNKSISGSVRVHEAPAGNPAVVSPPPKPSGASESAAITPGQETGTIGLQYVTFGYDADSPVLRDVSFSIPAETMCVLVGPSGSGKATTSRLIVRLWEINWGSVKAGGLDVREQSAGHLMKQLSLVFQDVYLFDDTLEANIPVGNPGATHEEVEHAARLTGVTEVVARLPEGYTTRVGEGGQALSGGERQRVSVARALLKQAPIVLLDKATSALDAKNEADIITAMEELRRHTTLLVIVHKMETIAGADQVVVLGEDGRVEAVEMHQELLARPGTYQRHWRQCEQASGWRLA